VPGNVLFSTRPEPGVRWLVETDPRFADYRTWLSSDFMLAQLGRDPGATLKRLGDGYYEQRLIADQIIYATGYRFVGDYRDDEAQYQALMQAGVEFGNKFQLTVGVALSQEQMKQLTSDLVWLVEQDVTLADGSVQRVLVPQVYVVVKEGDLRGDGTLISARSIDLNLTGDLDNNALIATRDLMQITAQNIHNVSGGRLQGGTVELTARNDLNNLSGIIAGNAVTLEAGRDVNIRTRTIDTKGLGTKVTGTDVIAGVSADNLTITAGRDLNVQGARIEASKDLLLTADRNLAIGTVRTGDTLDIAVSGHIKATEVKHVGSVVSAGNNLTMAAGMQQDGDLKVTGSTLSATKDLTAIGTNVSIASAVDTFDVDIVTRKKNATDTVLSHRESAVASVLTAGENLSIAAKGSKDGDGKAVIGTGNLSIQGAQIGNTKGTLTLAANNNIDIVEHQINQSEHTDHVGKNSSLLSKTSSVRISDSSSRQAVGSRITGDTIVISSGNDATIRGSSVAGNGDVSIYARNDVKIVAAEEQSSAGNFEETRKSATGVGKVVAAVAAVSVAPILGAGAFNRKDAMQNAEQTQTTVVGSSVSGTNVDITSGRDTLIKGSTVVANIDVDINAGRNLDIVSAQETRSEQAINSSSARGLLGGLSVGKTKQNQEGSSDSITQIGSQIGSLGSYGTGNVILRAGEQYTQTASSVLAVAGNVDIAGKAVTINEAYDTSEAAQRSRSSKTAIGIEVSSPLLSSLQGIKGMADAARNTSDERTLALAAINAGMNARSAVDSAQQLASGNLGGIKVTASIGSSKSESSSQQQTSSVVGSSVAAGSNVSITATGAGKDSNLNATAANISAGNDATLKADNQVNLLAAQSTLSAHSENKSSGASIGIGFAIGGGQNGFTLEASASKARGNTDGSDVVNVNSHVRAGNIVAIESGGDTTLKGAVIAGNTVKAGIGGNLNIESLQDSSRFDSRQTSSGIGVSVCIPPFCYGTSSISGSAGKTNVNADYLGVVEQSGIKAGDGGFNVTVKGNTDLKGAVIASTQAAVDEGRNKLVTASLTQSDLQNRDVYEAKGYGVSVTIAGKLGDQGTASTSEDRDAASDTKNPSKPGAGAGIGNASGSQGSVTASGISGAAITLTDEAKQKELTGQDGAATIAKAQTGVTTDKDKTGALTKAWDGKTLMDEVSAQIAVTQAFSQVAPRAVADFAGRRAAELRAEGKEEEARKWDENGAYRIALHTAAGALGGGTSGALGAAAVASLASQLDKLQASVEEVLVKQGMSEGAARTLAQGLAQATSAGVGAIVGGTQGGATALTVDTNNRQLHPGDYKVAKTLAAKSGGKYTEEEILNALRYSGIRDANGNIIVAEGTQEIIVTNADGKLVNVKSGTTIQDTYKVDGTISLRPDKTYPMVLVEDSPAQPSNELMAYITANTGGTASPYVLTPSATVTIVSSLPTAPEGTRRVTTMVDGVAYFPLVANCPAAGCTNGSPIATAVQDDATKAYLEAVDRKIEKDFNIASTIAGLAGSTVRAVKAVDDIVSAAVAANTAGKTASTVTKGGTLADDTQFLIGETQLKPKQGSLTGAPEAPPRNASVDQVRAVQRQNEAAEILADHGLSVERLPNTGRSGANPDLKINGQLADVASPTSSSVSSIRLTVVDKVERQAPNVVLNLSDSPLAASDIAQYIQRNPVSGLDSLILIKNGIVTVLRVR
jgi:filamentous hemagglutinin